jgi:chromate reductase
MASTSDTPLTVLGIAGSLRAGSLNKALLRAAVELSPKNLEIRVYERLGDIPLYNADVEAKGDPEPVAAFKSAIASADALLVVTPEYNYGIPGPLKNAVDWASRPPNKSVLRDKPAAIMGASSGGIGTARAQLSLRQSFVFTNTLVMPQPEVLVARATEKFDESGKLKDDSTGKFVRQLLEALADWTLRVRRER